MHSKPYPHKPKTQTKTTRKPHKINTFPTYSNNIHAYSIHCIKLHLFTIYKTLYNPEPFHLLHPLPPTPSSFPTLHRCPFPSFPLYPVPYPLPLPLCCCCLCLFFFPSSFLLPLLSLLCTAAPFTAAPFALLKPCKAL